MKKKKLKILWIIFSVTIVLLSVGCKKDTETKGEQPKSIKILCEDTVFPMVNDLVRDYNSNNDPVVTVESIDRERAFNKLNGSEVELLLGYVQPDNKGIENEILAYDGIGIIVNSSNKVNSVGTSDLKKIYTGNIVNWEKLKGESKVLIPVAFKSTLNSVQYAFDRKIMDTPVKEQMSSTIQYVESVEEMKNFVAQNKNAIGFMPGQWYNKESVFLKLNGIEITTSNLKNELYSLRFPIRMYYSKEKKDSLKDLFQYFKSEDGKKIIRKYCIEAF
ncbi:substrate-binding domain-containing protein [Clostridium sp. CF012]|uniref:substrate-binding domain-containing protein n=1 Tax=Clostridium sp. CF012 TaxID=2843319 RepID=UPI001C0BAE17|nr:substrate-binding domain-containing protein [Clostridium sp. CF012]MBU3141947.1 substrate-binding domain-containing protein [Clostridium sp. CF012]